MCCAKIGAGACRVRQECATASRGPTWMVDNPQSEGVTRFVVKRVGVVGLGHMGHAFAVNLVEDGYQVLAYDRDPKRAAALTGARAAAELADLASCDVA